MNPALDKIRHIGDKVWVPRADVEGIEETCPDCLGTARWHCVLPNGEEFDVECPRCYHSGYEPSNGRVTERHEVQPRAIETTIDSVCIEKGKEIEYTTADHHVYGEASVFDSEEPAKAASLVKAREYHDYNDATMLALAKKKGRTKREKDNRGIVTVTQSRPCSTAAYARAQVAAAHKEMQRWIDFAARHGTIIVYPSPQQEIKP